MGFTLQLQQDLVEVEAGGNSPVTIIVSNRGDAADRFELEIEGLDSDWKAIPVSTFGAESGETRTERAFFKPPRASESSAGTYPFVVSVRSLTTGEVKTAQGVLRVKPFHSLTLEINPKKGVHSWSIHRIRFEISLTNLGNTEHTLQLVGSDPEDACTYEFDHERITVGPGQQEEVVVEVRPVSSPLISGSKLIGFSIHARSVDVPSVVASGQAQLERRSLLSPANLSLLVVLLLMCAAWYAMRPKQPGIEIQVTPMTGLPGDKVVISWVAHDADQVRITMDDPSGSTEVYRGTEQASSIQWQLGSTPGIEQFVAEASKGANRSGPVTKKVEVNAPAEPVTPKIISFAPEVNTSANAKEIRVKLHQQIVFDWQVEGAVMVALTPNYPTLDPSIGSQAVTFDSPGETTIQLVAKSKDGISVRSKSFKFVTYDQSDAKIISFTAFPLIVPTGGVVTLTWNVVNATPGGISIKHDGIVDSSLQMAGTRSYTVTHDTTFVLQALDSTSRYATPEKITVKLQPPPTPGPTTSGPTDGTGQTAGTTGINPSGPPPIPATGGNDSGTTTTGR